VLGGHRGDLKVGIKCLKKSVLVIPRHSPKSGVRNEKTFFFKKFFLIFLEGVGRSEGS